MVSIETKLDARFAAVDDGQQAISASLASLSSSIQGRFDTQTRQIATMEESIQLVRQFAAFQVKLRPVLVKEGVLLATGPTGELILFDSATRGSISGRRYDRVTARIWQNAGSALSAAALGAFGATADRQDPWVPE